MELNEKIRYYRKQLGLTQEQTADAIGVQRGAFAYYETGKCVPKLDALRKLAKLFKITVDELIENASEDKVAQDTEPEFDTGWSTTDKFNDLSDFEQSVLLKVRLMSREEKEKLVEYLCK